jgi:hypothetical protein
MLRSWSSPFDVSECLAVDLAGYPGFPAPRIGGRPDSHHLGEREAGREKRRLQMTDANALPIVEARRLQKVYDAGAVRVEALKGVDLASRPGEMVSIMGPSGCGKTTLLNCLSGLDSIDEGDVLIEGVSLAAMSDRAVGEPRNHLRSRLPGRSARHAGTGGARVKDLPGGGAPV